MLEKYFNLFSMNLFIVCSAFCVCLGFAQLASADQESAACAQATSPDVLALHQIVCMTDEELQTFRGGFIRDNQIVIGFGFERIVRIDGEVQEHILAGLPSLNLPNNILLVPINRSIDAGGSRFILDDAGSGSAFAEGRSGLSPQLQVAPSTAALQDMMSNVIQNSLDDRVIDQIRVINIDLMGLGAHPGFSPQTDLNPAMFENLGL
jgi:hypothetical protein